jgi:hypothetical protein
LWTIIKNLFNLYEQVLTQEIGERLEENIFELKFLMSNNLKNYTAINSALKVDADISIIRVLVDLIVDSPAAI